MSKRHVWDELADEIDAHVEDSAQFIARGITGGGPAPFSANAKTSALLDYYRARFASPAGGLMTPDEALTTPDGQRIGKRGVAAVYEQLNQPVEQEA